jgi:hypothetical protein
MIDEVAAGLMLLAITAIIHAAGMTVMLRWVLRSKSLLETRFLNQTWLLVRAAWCLVGMHLIEIVVWALFFWRQGCMPDLESAVYFSGVTYTTIGYGDLILPSGWRLLGPLEGLSGILMCGLSTGFFFVLVTKLYGARTKV